MDNKEIIGGIGTYAHFAYGFVRQARPKIILEIGLGESGWGADAILKALDENKQEGFQEDCQYYCIDKFPTKTRRSKMSFCSKRIFCEVSKILPFPLSYQLQ